MMSEPQEFARGGLVSGTGGPSDDRVPQFILHGCDYVVRASAISDEIRKQVRQLNRSADRRR